MDHAGFWARVNDHLDERRDPLDDAMVTEHLAAHPELLEEFAELACAVTALSATPMSGPASARRHTTRRRTAAIAGLVLLGFGVSIGGWHLASSFSAEPVIVLPDLADDGEVLGYTSRSYTLGFDGQVERRVEALSVAIHERELRTRVQPGVATPHGHSISTELSHLSSRVRPEHLTN